ncbi:hypothetical protein PENSPDRAFT_649473 [Peniophora sp. CONT]|nr:hypothetical protein PENSPDRAFT_649473 [Peniophora sp. CONT]
MKTGHYPMLYNVSILLSFLKDASLSDGTRSHNGRPCAAVRRKFKRELRSTRRKLVSEGSWMARVLLQEH